MRTLKKIIKEHIEYRKQISKLAKSEMVKAYKGTALGWSWVLIKPAINIFVYWFAFSYGLRGGDPIAGYPFFLWLIAGLIPWFYMRDMLTGGANSMRSHRYLITKIKFPISTIPTFVSVSFLYVELMLLAVTIVIYMAFGYMPDIYYLQIPIYILFMFMFSTTWGLLSGLLSAMSRDFLNFVRPISMALFWMSGILYDATSIEVEWIRTILLFNPITLLVNGFRNCFVYKTWIWENPTELLNFTIIFAIELGLALWAYKKLYKEIPDVL